MISDFSVALAVLMLLGGLVLPSVANASVDEEGAGFTPATGEETTMDAWSSKDAFELTTVSKEEVETLTKKHAKTHQVFLKYRWAPKLPGGVDHIAAGVGTRNTGFGAINLQGTPVGSTPVSAFLFVGVIMANPPATLTVNFQGTPVTAFQTGTTAQPCWNPAGTFAAYRANVLPQLNAGINGVYLVSGMPSNLTDGRDPANPPNNTLPLSEGASLVVLYSHRSVPAGSFVQIDNVVQMTSANLVVQHFLNQPVTNGSALKHTRLGADGQPGIGNSHFAFATNESTFLGPIGGASSQIRGIGSPLDTDSDWNGNDAHPLNQLWDTNTLLVPGAIPTGTANYQVTYSLQGDCVVPVAHVLTAR